jgi:hypothetical protein
MTTTSDARTILLTDPVAQEMLRSTIPARLAYTWHDGTPRVIPIWFHWTGDEILLGAPPNSPKIRALATHPAVSLTIDTNDWPCKVLMIRGVANVAVDPEPFPEWLLAAPTSSPSSSRPSPPGHESPSAPMRSASSTSALASFPVHGRRARIPRNRSRRRS